MNVIWSFSSLLIYFACFLAVPRYVLMKVFLFLCTFEYCRKPFQLGCRDSTNRKLNIFISLQNKYSIVGIFKFVTSQGENVQSKC